MGAPEGPPAVSIQALRPAHEPGTLIVLVRGSIERTDAARVADEVAGLIRATGPQRLVCDVGGLIRPNAATVDVVCRIRLAARRVGCRLRLRRSSPELVRLLDLMGLCDVVEDDSGLDGER